MFFGYTDTPQSGGFFEDQHYYLFVIVYYLFLVSL
jgi:hypothetical protein